MQTRRFLFILALLASLGVNIGLGLYLAREVRHDRALAMDRTDSQIACHPMLFGWLLP